MSILGDCCNPCPTTTTVNVPGSAGTSGVNAFTTTTADINLPNQGVTIPVHVINSQWMIAGQNVFVSDGAHVATFSVESVPAVAPFTSAFLNFLQYSGDSVPTSVIATGAMVTPTGIQAALPVPILVIDGGTGATTALGARTNLGAAASGANSDITSINALSTPLSIAQGGTGAITAPDALLNLEVQTGTVSLVSGVATITAKTLTGSSVIVCNLNTPLGTRTAFGGYRIVVNGTGVGTSSFTISAMSTASGNATVLTSCTDVVDYCIIG